MKMMMMMVFMCLELILILASIQHCFLLLNQICWVENQNSLKQKKFFQCLKFILIAFIPQQMVKKRQIFQYFTDFQMHVF